MRFLSSEFSRFLEVAVSKVTTALSQKPERQLQPGAQALTRGHVLGNSRTLARKILIPICNSFSFKARPSRLLDK